MIFYFTGTGNSKHIAEKIAADVEDRILNIADCVQGKQFKSLKGNRNGLHRSASCVLAVYIDVRFPQLITERNQQSMAAM